MVSCQLQVDYYYFTSYAVFLSYNWQLFGGKARDNPYLPEQPSY